MPESGGESSGAAALQLLQETSQDIRPGQSNGKVFVRGVRGQRQPVTQVIDERQSLDRMERMP